MKIPYTEIKHPLVYLHTDDSQSIWWKDSEGDITVFDDLPNNYPRFVVHTFDSKEQAEKRFNEMVNEGWEVGEISTWKKGDLK